MLHLASACRSISTASPEPLQRSGRDASTRMLRQVNSIESEDGLTGLTVPGLTKREAVLRVRLKQLELDEKTGTVVNRDSVHAALFAVGQQLRTRIEAVPDQVIDNLLAATNRSEAYLLLQQEIHSALTEISNLGNVELNNTRQSKFRSVRFPVK